ncbi:PRC-barrel domain containing protein [Agrobacterium sp. a22-2]|uniref:PRC-barrel domain-containing protein n=1 Tax=Agrobacterium sp. a22-2 TaxID=2283840 RepID=UPI001446D151|nr:PRC-barrel domain-containing protein [Agrobacterium sp. a22-2]NKN35019.1 PRC-barrel domain containing protein [Agrobacterium sp. a22-2]
MLHQNSARQQNPDVHETPALIASDKVEGTKVYGSDGKHIGSIERIILEKRGGRVSYAVLSFGGFLGMGHDHYPLPWEKLSYDEDLDGYRIDLTKADVENAPRFTNENEADWYRDNGRKVYDYYGIPPYWM